MMDIPAPPETRPPFIGYILAEWCSTCNAIPGQDCHAPNLRRRAERLRYCLDPDRVRELAQHKSRVVRAAWRWNDGDMPRNPLARWLDA